MGKARLYLVQGDITVQSTDAIVNAANSSLMGGGGVDGAIHRAGGTTIVDACREIVARSGRLDTGKAVITTAGNLTAKYVIHTVGPVWHDGTKGEAGLLASAYQQSLKLATDYKLKSIAFPSISTGAYGYPVEDAARVALKTVVNYFDNELTTSLEEVFFVLYDSMTYQVYCSTLSEHIAQV